MNMQKDMQKSLIEVVSQNPGLKAAQLAILMKDTKSSVNHDLYAAKAKGILEMDDAYRWYAVEPQKPEIELHSIAKDIIENTSDNLLILGKAGTGKTYFLDEIVKTSKKLIAVLAPSGIAAVKAKGVTIHSFFRFDILPYIPGQKAYIRKISQEKQDLIRHLDTIIIDEISMVRVDLMDRIDVTLKAIRNNNNPFGGIQIVMIGDLRQLPPVVENNSEEEKAIQENYKSAYFFDSKILQNTPYKFVEFNKVYRQGNASFIELLNRVRENKVTENDIITLNRRYDFNARKRNDADAVTLVTHRYQASQVNKSNLQALPYEEQVFRAIKEGWYREDDPAPYMLHLKKGAHVMFLSNNGSEYSNGTLGVVTEVDYDTIKVRITATGKIIEVEPNIWHDFDYVYDKETNSIRITNHGTYEQYPLQLAWAITVHKSQGQTLNKIKLDINKCFAGGQAYVALSRCPELKDITLLSKITKDTFMTDPIVDEFLKKIYASQIQ